MDADTTDLKIALTEARTETKFAELMGEMRTGFGKINTRLDGLETRLDGLERSVIGVKPTILGTGIAVIAVVVAVLFGALTYGQAWFGIGSSTRDIVKSAVAEYVAQHPLGPPSPSLK